MKLDGIFSTFFKRDCAMAKLEDRPKSQPATSLALAYIGVIASAACALFAFVKAVVNPFLKRAS